MNSQSFLKCPKCSSVHIQKYGFIKLVNSINITQFTEQRIIIKKQRYKCKKCGHVWREK